MTTITIQSEGRRHYLIGNTYPIKDKLRAAGAKWDSDRKAWWTGKRDLAEQLASGASAEAAPAAESGSSPSASREAPGEGAIVAGRATYKGKTYYVAGRVERGRTHYDDRASAVTSRDGSRILLLFRDGSSQFWAARGDVQIGKTYDRPQTIGRLKRFAEEARNGTSRQDYQDAIDAAEDMDSFGEVKRLERIGYDGWRAEQK
ncbi:MAG TPA: hypothetical protein VJN18_32645 [Polyangiaceae bacterium]|nr:hypothetical protein [Polyangiaceae bacterium]